VLAALVIVVVWSRRTRWRVLRLAARARAWGLQRAALAARIGAAVAVVGLAAWGVSSCDAPVGALAVGSGLRGDATVETFTGADWDGCPYDRVTAEFRCRSVSVLDTTWNILNDEQPMWAFTTPAIYIRSSTTANTRVRVTVTRHLAGRYWIGSMGNPVKVAVEGLPELFTNRQLDVDIPDGDREVTIDAIVPPTGLWVTFVREDTLEPVRSYPEAPDAPPHLEASR
jgi:hypothetical protein